MPVFLFTDIEGSTRLWERDPEAMAAAVTRHDALLHDAVVEAGGKVVKSTGDGIMAVFDSSAQAVAAATRAQRSLATVTDSVEVRVRMGIHSGPAESRGDDWFGSAVNKAARIADTAHGAQIVISEEAAAELRGDPADVDLRDLGRHPLKDLEGEHGIFQVESPGLSGAFPALRTVRRAPNNLPAPPTRLVGRLSQLRAAHDALRAPETRLVTLTGPGGMGKTRLALQIATDALGRHPHGVWFVQLAPLSGEGSVAQAIRTTLGISDRGGGDAVAQLVGRLVNAHALLVLDNFEHVLDEAADVARLLAECAQLHVLATSRTPLRLRGERVLPLPSLSVPTGSTEEDVAGSDAGRLFVERAQDLDPSFALDARTAAPIASVTRALEGIPLAVEIAAGRLADMDLGELAERIGQRLDTLTSGPRDLPARQQTLRAAIQWSWDLLTKSERTLLCRLAVLPGGATVGSAAAAADMAEVEVQPLLERLTASSLLTEVHSEDGSRWAPLESIREFALERLEEDDDPPATNLRAARWVLAQGIEMRPLLNGHRQPEALRRLTDEADNVRYALRVLIDGRLPEAAQLADAVSRWWILRGQLKEGIAWLEQATEAAPADAPFYRAALVSLAGVAGTFGDHAKAATVAQRVLDLCEGAEHQDNEISAVNILASIATLRDEYEVAESLYRRNRELLLKGSNKFSLAVTTNNLGLVLQNIGRLEESLALHEEALAIFEQEGDAAGQSTSLKFIGTVHRRLESWDQSEDAYVRALKLSDEAGHRNGVPEVLGNLALVREAQGRLDEARSLLDEASALAVEVGSPRARSLAADRRASLERRAGKVDLAVAYWDEAADILEQAGSEDAAAMRDKARAAARGEAVQ